MSSFPPDDSLQFAQLLLDDGLIRQEDWNIAESIRHVQGGRIIEILLGLCPLSEEELYRAIARQLNYPFWTEMDLVSSSIPDALLLRFPISIALECDFLPILWEEHGRRLHIVLPNPLDVQTLNSIQMYAQADELVIGVATPSDVVTAIQVHYKPGHDEKDSREPSEFFAGSEPSAEFFLPEQSGHSISPPKRQMRECPACQNMEPVVADICSRCSSPMDLSDADPLLGKVLKGFRLNQKLGEGGMGLVYGAQHADSRQEAAVKILRSHLSSNERVVRRFHREAQAQNQLRHPNIVHVHDFGFEKGVGFFIAMEFLRGMSLEEILEEHHNSISVGFIHAVFCQVCDAMGLAHSRGIFHRDLKPDNIFLLDDEQHHFFEQPHIKILDFGVAKMVASEEDERLTRTGMTIGTPRYMAPEQAGDGNTDHRSDIYSLGVILFELLTGQPPFEGSSAYQIMLRHVYADPPALSHVRPDLPFPHELEDFLNRALAKDPQDRPASMDMFWRECRPALERFEAALPGEYLLHSPVEAPLETDQDSLDSAPAPVFVGRLAPEEPKPQPKEPSFTSAPPPTASRPGQEYYRDYPPKENHWLEGGELDVWESNLDFEESNVMHISSEPPTVGSALESYFEKPLYESADVASPFTPPPASSAPVQQDSNPYRPFPTTTSGEYLKSTHSSDDIPLSPYSFGGNRSTPPPVSRAPRTPTPPSSKSFSPAPTGRQFSLDDVRSQENVPVVNTSTPIRGGVSLRSSGAVRSTQRSRFSNALKKQPKKEKSPVKFLLLVGVGILLFLGGLALTWLFLIQGH